MRSSWRLLIVGVLFFAAVGSTADNALASWFGAGYRYDLQLYTNYVNTSANPPVSYSVESQNYGSGSQHVTAIADRGILTSDHWAQNYGGGSAAPDQFPLATMRFEDVVFTCDDGSPTVTVSLNLWVEGQVFYPYGMNAGVGGSLDVGVKLNGEFINLGKWVAGGGGTGAFAGETAHSVAGVFTTPTLTVPTDVPLTLEITTIARVRACCQHGMTAHTVFRPINWAAGPTTPTFGVRFANLVNAGPVFNFHNVNPEVCCTVNSAEADIADECPVPVEPTSWGRIKALYR